MASDDERTGTCVVCQVRDPLPELVPVCGPDRSRVRHQLQEIPELCAELADPPAAALANDPASMLLPAGMVRGQSNAPRVGGSREAPVPISLDTVDLLSDARLSSSATRALSYPEQDEDQVGYLSAATVLDGWCRDWAEIRRESVPRPHPDQQCGWLLDRWDWACTEHNAVDEFAAELGDLWHVLRRITGRTEPKPELCEGIPCRSPACDLKTLVRLPGSSWVECSSCGNLLSEAEYQECVRMVRAQLCAAKNGDWWCALPRKHDGRCVPLSVLRQLAEEGTTVHETVEQRRERVYRETLAEEAAATETYLWWLSFTDPDITAGIPKEERRPGGKSFLGVCIVEAATQVGATIAAHVHGCNPGGQVATFGPFPAGSIPDEWLNRLLTKDEAGRVPVPTS